MFKKTILLLFVCLCHFASAQDVKKDFKTESISIFKNGTAFFVKSGKGETKDNIYRMTENIPPALFGTYWVLSPTEDINFLSSYVDTLKTKKTYAAATTYEMLYANLGQKVKLHLDKGEIIEGTVEELKDGEPLNPNRISGLLVNFKMEGKWLTFHATEVRRIEFLENPKQLYEKDHQEVKPVLQVNFNNNKKAQPLDMMYLSKGLNWTPTYLIELTSEKKATLTLRAEVYNNIEDIENTSVNFVVGVPNFSDAKSLSALVDFEKYNLNRNNQAEYNFHNVNFSNFSQTQNTNAYAAQQEMNAAASTNAGGLDGSAEEDLYFYTMKNMSLKKGGRGHYPVFKADVRIAHIYECNLPQNVANKNQYKQDYFFSINPNKVIHSLKVNNDTKYPFTTGPALVVKQQGDTKPISQDRLNYTSISGHSFVKLTEAPDVQITQAEKAIKTEKQSKKINRNNHIYTYDLITVEGQVKIKNYKTKDIDLNVKRTIIGDLQKSSIKWLTSERITTNNDLNKLTDVCWETSVKAGKELKVVYTYQIYVLH